MEKIKNGVLKAQKCFSDFLEKRYIRKTTKFFEKNSCNIYILGLIIFLTAVTISDYTVIGDSINQNIFAIVKYIGVLIICLKLFFNDIKQYSYRDILNVTCLFAVVIFITLFSKNRTLFQYFFFIIAAKDVPFKKIVKSILILEVVIFILLLSLSSFNLIENRIYNRTNKIVNRYSLGYKDCKYPAIFIWAITLMYIYIRDKKIKVAELLGLITLNVIIFIFTDSKSELACSLLVILGTMFLIKIDKTFIKKIMYYTSKYIMIVFFIIAFLTTFFYNPKNPTMKQLDTILSGRLNLSHKAFNNYGVTPFGQHIEWKGLNSVYLENIEKKEMNFVDCSYLKIMFEYGIVGIGLLIIGYTKLIQKKNIKNNDILLLIFIVINIHSLLDPQFFALPINIFLLMLNEVLFNREKIEEGEIHG